MIHRDPEPILPRRLSAALLCAAVVLIFGIAGTKDYEDEQSQAAHYCDMVQAGAWPAYRPEIECEEQSDG